MLAVPRTAARGLGTLLVVNLAVGSPGLAIAGALERVIAARSPIVDLSHPLNERIPANAPGEPFRNEPRAPGDLSPVRYTVAAQAGTHVDAPAQVLRGGASVEKIPPQNLENLFKESPFLGPCLIHGDRRHFLTAIFTLDADEIVPWGRARGIFQNGSTAPAELLRVAAGHEDVRRLVEDVVGRTNQKLATFEQIKRWAIVPDRWTVEDGALTPTLKIKRKVLENRYRAILDGFYEGEKT